MNKLKILYVMPRFYPFKGGAEENTFQLASRMAKEGHEVTVLTTDASPNGEKLPREEEIAGMKVIRTHRWNQQLNLGFYPGFLPKLLSIKADVIHIGNGPGFIWQEKCLLLKKLVSPKTKMIITPHGPFLSVTPNSFWKKIVALPAKIVMPIYFKQVWRRLFHMFIQVNPSQEVWLAKDYSVDKKIIRTVPNGINKELITPLNKSKFDSDVTTLTFIGRFEKYKGIHEVITAISRVIDENQNLKDKIRFKVLGRPGAYYPTLKEMVEKLELGKVVAFVTNPSDQERDNILINESNIHILPSQWEATGIVLLEAMATGNAIITTTNNEAHDLLVEEGQNGFVYEFGDIDSLVEIIRQLIESSDLTRSMAEYNLEKIKSFTWDQIFIKYKEVIAEVTNDKTSVN